MSVENKKRAESSLMEHRAIYEAIKKGRDLPEPGMPESFKVLVNELKALAIDVTLIASDNAVVDIVETEEVKPFGISEALESVLSDTLGMEPEAVREAVEEISEDIEEI